MKGDSRGRQTVRNGDVVYTNHAVRGPCDAISWEALCAAYDYNLHKQLTAAFPMPFYGERLLSVRGSEMVINSQLHTIICAGQRMERLTGRLSILANERETWRALRELRQ